MVNKEKSYQKRDPLISGAVATCHKGIEVWQAFLSRIYATAAKLKKLHYYTRLNKGFHSDLHWWNTFLVEWNGLNLLRNITATPSPDYHIQTDASGSWGCGA